jgi:hypothetical protein
MPLLGTRGAASARGFGFAGGAAGIPWPVGTTFTFYTAETRGHIGPSQATLLAYYSGQLFLPYFSAVDGIQYLSDVPAGNYRFRLYGAVGNSYNNPSGNGGYGAIVQEDFVIPGGSTISMICGQQGLKTGSAAADSQPGGGASSFWVGTNAAAATQYGIAGGGGGAMNGGAGDYATTSINGANSDGQNTGNAGASTDYSSGGAGWLTNAPNTSGNAGGQVAQAPRNGGLGYYYFNGSAGGFGGGGGQSNSGGNRAGAGGGYTGGNGRDQAGAIVGSGGGGSKLVGGVGSGTFIGSNGGEGYIQITKLS